MRVYNCSKTNNCCLHVKCGETHKLYSFRSKRKSSHKLLSLGSHQKLGYKAHTNFWKCLSVHWPWPQNLKVTSLSHQFSPTPLTHIHEHTNVTAFIHFTWACRKRIFWALKQFGRATDSEVTSYPAVLYLAVNFKILFMKQNIHTSSWLCDVS